MTHTAAQALDILGEEDTLLGISALRTAASEPRNLQSVVIPYIYIYVYIPYIYTYIQLVGWLTNGPSSAQLNLFKKN